MNNDQLKHIASTLSALAFAQFAAFGFVGLRSESPDWLLVGVSGIGFINLQALAVWVLSYVTEERS